MESVLGVASAIFWGLLVLSILVFIHEGGHYLAARLFGMRVTEFFLGMPCSLRLSHKSKKYGTEVGVTPILLGGYTRICGMEGEDDEALADVLACVQKHGRVSVAEVADELGIDVAHALSCLTTLADWASIVPVAKDKKALKGNDATGEDLDGGSKSDVDDAAFDEFETLARDANLLCEYDKQHDFAQKGTTQQGEARPVDDSQAFLAEERSHTYLGANFIQRVIMLVAGPLVNIIAAFLIVVCSLMIGGVEFVSNVSTVSAVTPGSLAAEAGIVGGDTITRVGDDEVSTWLELSEALNGVLSQGTDFEVVYLHEGEERTATVKMSGPQSLFGVSASTEVYHPTLIEAAQSTLSYAGMVGEYALRVITPTKTIETLEQSSSIVGISVMASEAAATGFIDLALLAGAISMSLGFMNLLPIPPLDGGKIVIEIIQLIIGRQLSLRVQAAISWIGLAFFLFIFIFVLRNDIIRYVLGG